MSDTDQKELETLRRMLATPPTPHKPIGKGEPKDGKRPSGDKQKRN